tara:strand:+ start:1329 stop:2618 length:1290 start_codon:yes stop_codon:yes gene_type:complete
MSEPSIIKPEDINPNYNWHRRVPSHGKMNVDYEERINFQRLHKYRIGRAKQALNNSKAGSLLCFDNNNIRYLTSTVIGEWSRDKIARYSLLPQGHDPILWDFGSAAKHHQLFSPWLPEGNWKAGMVGLRGTVHPDVGLMTRAAKEIKSMLAEKGLDKEPIGVDLVEPSMMFALQAEGLNIIDGQQILLEAREIKSQDELMLLNQAASMVDATYHQIYETMKPGVSEAQIVANANKLLYELGSDDVEAINAISGERCNPHPHNFTDRTFRPGDQAFFDILQSYMGYRTCYYRTFNIGRASDVQNDAYKQCREWLDKAIDLVKPGASTDKIASVWPKAEEFGFANEMDAFALQFGHGLGLAIHERPMISRLVSMDSPTEIKEGMVFALETYCPAKDGYSAARIEEELIVTDKGCQIISLFPAEELPIANKY